MQGFIANFIEKEVKETQFDTTFEKFQSNKHFGNRKQFLFMHNLKLK